MGSFHRGMIGAIMLFMLVAAVSLVILAMTYVVAPEHFNKLLVWFGISTGLVLVLMFNVTLLYTR